MSDSAFIFPITPATPMSEFCDMWQMDGKLNAFGETTKVTQMQSELGAVGALHGALATGAMGTTFTSSQGLLLMYPNLFEIAGEMLPTVIHVAARAVNMQGITIFGDHSDVMAVRQSGFCQLCSGSVQEVMDLGVVSHLAAVKASLPFMHFFEGFRTSHEINTIDIFPEEDMKKMMDFDKIEAIRNRGVSPENPHIHGIYEQNDVYMQMTERPRIFYQETPEIVQEMMNKVAEKTGREYKLFDYFGDKDAEKVIVCMGSGGVTAENTVKIMQARGEKVGMIKVRLYRPFSQKHLLEALPESCKKIAVLDRTIESGSFGEPLYLDIVAALHGERDAQIYGGRYGIGGKEFTTGMVKAVFDNLDLEEPKNHFTVGINDDVCHTSLPYSEFGQSCLPEGTTECLFWGMGSDGTVGSNKTAIKLLTENAGLQGQAYFAYSAHKSGGLTISHLRFGPEEIDAPYLCDHAKYVAVHQTPYIQKYGTKLLEAVAPGGTLVLNTPWNTVEELEANLPTNFIKMLAERNVKLYNVDATKVAEDVGMRGRINMVMQSVFFHLSQVLPEEKVMPMLEQSIRDEFGLKGEAIVQGNIQACNAAMENTCAIDYPESWAQKDFDTSVNPLVLDPNAPDFVKHVMVPVAELRGDDLPVSVFTPGGKMPVSTTQYEKRGLAPFVANWNADQCSLQCNTCASVCPHAVIRPFFAETGSERPESFEMLPSKVKQLKGEYDFRIQLSPYDCTGCGVCASMCPVDAINMVPFGDVSEVQNANWEFAQGLPDVSDKFMSMKDRASIKGSQMHQPLLEFHGACAGCTEPTYVKLITQLFGEQTMFANASGCSSVWGATFPNAGFTTNKDGHGPSFGWSLFEDGAEFGLGMALSTKRQRDHVHNVVGDALANGKAQGELKDALEKWSESWMNLQESRETTKLVKAALENASGSDAALVEELKKNERYLSKKSQWVFGGDGWAYDIGFGGVDHVLATNEDINIIVLDSEVYSNTGGQSSKSSPRAAVTKFQAHGKNTGKKDLGMMAMSYGHCYVASVALGAKPQHYLKVLEEAESFPGTSLIIAYCPCIEHGISGGLAEAAHEQQAAVDSGYWLLYRFDPRREAEGKNPLQLDSKPKLDKLPEFLERDNRFKSLARIDPELQKTKQDWLKEDFAKRWNTYQTLAGSGKAAKGGKKKSRKAKK
eukprot:TRINITY_DN130_c0_g2_i1.p1 TRINITY_DN130_c0_g2~~TRINITY_DN130_c0_g2_i1.p1  ORF type:complete len:1237 (+),score=342.97 TRINITY_DN130_c0_g2_i1:178-3711(+)